MNEYTIYIFLFNFILQLVKYKYYILDAKEESVLEFSSKEEFEEKKNELKISKIALEDTEEYK